VTEIAAENNSTTIFPIPIELFRPFSQPAAAGAATSPPPQIKVEGSSALPTQIQNGAHAWRRPMGTPTARWLLAFQVR